MQTFSDCRSPHLDGQAQSARAVLHLEQSRVFGFGQATNRIYVRQRYIDLGDVLLQLADEAAAFAKTDTLHRLVVQALLRGTQGIGMSIVLAYLLWRIITQHRGPRRAVTIVWKDGPIGRVALMTYRDNQWKVDFSLHNLAPYPQIYADAVQAPYQRSSWVLLDSCVPPSGQVTDANTVLVTSPCAPAPYHEYQKYAQSLWVPVWTPDELEDCRSKV